MGRAERSLGARDTARMARNPSAHGARPERAERRDAMPSRVKEGADLIGRDERSMRAHDRTGGASRGNMAPNLIAGGLQRWRSSESSSFRDVSGMVEWPTRRVAKRRWTSSQVAEESCEPSVLSCCRCCRAGVVFLYRRSLPNITIAICRPSTISGWRTRRLSRMHRIGTKGNSFASDLLFATNEHVLFSLAAPLR